MKVTWRELFSDEASRAIAALKSLGDPKFQDRIPVASRIRIARVLTTVRKERDVFMEVYQPILDKYLDKSWDWVKKRMKTEGEKANPAAESARPKTVLPMFEQDYNDEIDEVLKHECELSLDRVPIKLLAEAPGITAGDFAMLDWLLTDGDESATRSERRGANAMRRKTRKKRT